MISIIFFTLFRIIGEIFYESSNNKLKGILGVWIYQSDKLTLLVSDSFFLFFGLRLFLDLLCCLGS
jgi:hypothetical protein